MLKNPFTPSAIASSPTDFFGRTEELRALERALMQGSVVIQGSIGIGKSSLLSRTRLTMEGFANHNNAKSILCVGDRDIINVDQAARLVLDAFINIDEKQNKVKFKIGNIFESESVEICQYFKEGKHLSVLKNILMAEYVKRVLNDEQLLIIAIDEVDKCPVPIARLVRSIMTHTQQNGVEKIRFMIAGVNPFFKTMIEEDEGISRFFYKIINLQPMSLSEAHDLITTKFKIVEKDMKAKDMQFEVMPSIKKKIVVLSGGHPHLLQLLGSHLIEHENEDPDDLIDETDLLNSLRQICYVDRGFVYDSTIHLMDVYGKLEIFKILLGKFKDGFPSRISRELARKNASNEDLQWLIEHNLLSTPTDTQYGLVDEFLRIRMIFDQLETEEDAQEIEKRLIKKRYETDEFEDVRFEFYPGYYNDDSD